tara:strand:+ start:1813 stop:2934 length:1122 start_codon:yes stop_codon:yes gene_type:complete
MTLSKISMRYPPFDRDRTNPARLDIIECVVRSSPNLIKSIEIGDVSSWHAHWKPLEHEYDGDIRNIDVSTEPGEIIISKRRGWFIKPDPLHRFSRKILPFGVFAIFSALILQAVFGNQLGKIPILGNILGTPIAIGPLDYPAILFIAFPLFIVPILLRIVSNLRDIRMQRKLNSQPLEDMRLGVSYNKENIILKINHCPPNFIPHRARVVVGMLVPERKELLDVVNRETGGQPPPGLSTPTPVFLVALGESDGSSVGESVPMALDNAGSLLLEPLRVSDSGSWVNVTPGESEVRLFEPEVVWPGSIYSPLFSIHWEVQIIGKKITQSKEKHDEDVYIGWSQEIIVPHRDENISIPDMPLSAVRDLDPIGKWPV